MPNLKKLAQEFIAINPEARRTMVSEEAYFLFEQRGFEGDFQLDDWLEAEIKIDHKYGPEINE